MVFLIRFGFFVRLLQYPPDLLCLPSRHKIHLIRVAQQNLIIAVSTSDALLLIEGASHRQHDHEYHSLA